MTVALCFRLWPRQLTEKTVVDEARPPPLARGLVTASFRGLTVAVLATVTVAVM
jgi:hypothetical protein